MTIQQLIQMLERRIVYLQSVRTSATTIGDMHQVERVEADINETQSTLNQLRTLSE